MARLTPDAVVAAQQILRPDAIADANMAGKIPAWAGAYALMIHLGSDRFVSIRGAQFELKRGWYAYAGSAKGPGGVGARLRRHLRAGKKMHWHVDALTCAADAMAALAMRDGSECDIVRRLTGSGRFAHAITGFGSSDCSQCRSHLLAWLGPPGSEQSGHHPDQRHDQERARDVQHQPGTDHA